MECVTVGNGIMCFSKVDFQCPHCDKKYSDADEKYYKRLEKSRKGYIEIKCSCGHWFGMSYDMTGKAVGFNIEKEEGE